MATLKEIRTRNSFAAHDAAAETRRFVKAVKKHTKRMTIDAALKELKEIAFEVLRGVVIRTPVDIGHAKAGWLVTSGAPATTVPLAVDKAGSTTMSNGRNVIDRHNNIKKILWIVNNVIYIGALEAGHSRLQAPQGMVRLTLQRIRRNL